MDPRQVLERANSSERIRDLLATTIRVGVRRVFGNGISFADARDLARVHTLTTAIEQIAKALDVHRELPHAEQRLKLAIMEAKLMPSTEGAASGWQEAAIIRARKTTFETFNQRRGADGTLQLTHSQLLKLRAEILDWGKSYRWFLRSLARLYPQRRQELGALRLSKQQMHQALEELDHIFASAIEASTHTSPGHATRS